MKTKIQIIEGLIHILSSKPESRWCEDEYTDPSGRHCVLGHLRVNRVVSVFTLEAQPKAVRDLIMVIGPNDPARINDGRDARYQQRHPKHRILAALNDALLKELSNFPSPELPSPSPGAFENIEARTSASHNKCGEQNLAAGII